MPKWDVVFWDDIGGPVSPSASAGAMGGSEYGLLLLARELGKRGLNVAVLSRTDREEWVENKDPYSMVWFAPIGSLPKLAEIGAVGALVVHRFSSIPDGLEFARAFVLATDIPDDRYRRPWPLLERGGALLCVSEWQAKQFDPSVRKIVVSPPLRDMTYSDPIAKKSIHKFVFTSAPMKGWSQTVDAWRRLKAKHRSFEPAVLYGSCGWGDMQDPGMPDIVVRGRVSPRAQVAELDDAHALFFVNSYPETFCAVAAIAEARGCRVYALPTSDPGALPTTMAQKVCRSYEELFDRVMTDYGRPLDAPVCRDFRASKLVPKYLDLLVGDQKSVPEVGYRTPTLCLVMMVKNEGAVIADAIRSARERAKIDAWSIVVDPKTTDDTREVILRELGDLPGKIHEPEFEGFDKTRTASVRLAEAQGTDYLLAMDADDVLEGDLDKDQLGALDGYNVRIYDAECSYTRTIIFRARAGWYYKYPAHEVLTNDQCGTTVGYVSSLAYKRFRSTRVGNAKVERDVAVLERALREEPNEPRMTFYLAQSYEQTGRHKKAIALYKLRAQISGGNEEEVFVSLYRVGHILESTRAPVGEVEAAYVRAWEARPQRIESLCHLSHYLSQVATTKTPNDRRLLARAYLYAKTAADAKFPVDGTFVEDAWYVWGARYQLSLAAIRMGHLREGKMIIERLLAENRLPEHEVESARANLTTCVAHAHEEVGSAEQSFKTEMLDGNIAPSAYFGTFLSLLKQAIAPGGSELGLGVSLFSLVVSTRARRVIEIGRFRGFSTLALASGLRFIREGWEETSMAKERPDVDYSKHESKDVMLVSIDPHPTEDARERVRAAGAEDFVRFVDASSEDAADAIRGECDLLFVDGDHSLDGCWRDVLLYAPKLREGGYMVLHDYFGWWGPNGENGSPIKKVCEMVEETGKFEHVLVDTGYMSFKIFRKVRA